jgi:hypothetical protein
VRDQRKAGEACLAPTGGGKETVTIRGAPIAWTLTIPDRGADAETARSFVRWLVTEKAAVLEQNGLRPLAKPRFFGPAAAYEPWREIATRAGGLP